jgi:hypothetical protein
MGDPTRDAFARRVAIAVRVAGGSGIDYDDSEFRLRFTLPDGTPKVADLSGAFLNWGTVPVRELTRRIQRFAAAQVGSAATVTDWEFVAPRLRPVLGPVHRTGRHLARAFLPFVDELVVVDHPGGTRYVLADDPARWGVDPAALFDRARRNLVDRARPDRAGHDPASPDRAGPDRPGPVPQPTPVTVDQRTILRVPDTAHLVLDGWLAGLGRTLGARPVAFIADGSTLTVVGDEPDAVAGLLELAEKEYLESAQTISPQAYTVDGEGRVVPYTVPDGDPLYAALHRSEVLLASAEYAAQRENHRDAVLAPYSMGQRDDGSVYSISVWGHTVDTLLPETEYVAVVDGARRTSLVPWDTVVRVTGIEREPGWSPPRYHTRVWPSSVELGALRAAAVRP